jgi:hypothetical protein
VVVVVSGCSPMQELPVSDENGDTKVQIQTDGDTFKPFLNALRDITAEVRMNFKSDEITAKVTDPANVIAISLTLKKEGLAGYDSAEFLTGIDLKRFRGITRRARMNSEDALSLSVGQEQITAGVSRDHSETTVFSEDAMRTLDPDSVRGRDTLPQPESMEYDFYSVSIPPTPFFDGFEHVANEVDHLKVHSTAGDFVVGSHNPEDITTAVRYEGLGSDFEGSAIFSTDIFRSGLEAIKDAKATSINIRYGSEVPIYIDFARERDGEEIMHGQIMQAPRIKG